MKLNLGGRHVRHADWISVDLELGQVAGDARRLPFRDDAFEAVFANHSLCAMPWWDLPAVLGEVDRVLAPEGSFLVSVPDVVEAFHAFMRLDVEWFPIGDSTCFTLDEKFTAYLTWFSTNLTCFTEGSLHTLLERRFKKVISLQILASPDPMLFPLELIDRRDESIFKMAWQE